MEPTIRVQSRLGKRRQRQRADAGDGRVHAAGGTPALPATDTLARRLALAHSIERLIEAGKIRNYAHAAAALGITRARISQLMDLVLLPANVQNRVLLGLESCEHDVRSRLHDHGESLGARCRGLSASVTTP